MFARLGAEQARRKWQLMVASGGRNARGAGLCLAEFVKICHNDLTRHAHLLVAADSKGCLPPFNRSECLLACCLGAIWGGTSGADGESWWPSWGVLELSWVSHGPSWGSCLIIIIAVIVVVVVSSTPLRCRQHCLASLVLTVRSEHLEHITQ